MALMKAIPMKFMAKMKAVPNFQSDLGRQKLASEI